MKVGGTALLVAIAGVALLFLMGWGIAVLWGQPQIESIFVGAAMVVTSVGIIAQVLAARGLLNTRAARIILAAAVIDDVLGLLVLALVSGLVRGSVKYLELAITAALAIGFTVFVAHFGTRTVRHVIPRVQARMRVGEAEFAIAMTLLFALSVLAVYAGVAAIVGCSSPSSWSASVSTSTPPPSTVRRRSPSPARSSSRPWSPNFSAADSARSRWDAAMLSGSASA